MVRRIATMLQVASINAWEELAELLHDDRVTVDRTGDDGAVHPDINLCPPDATAPALRQLLESIDALRQAASARTKSWSWPIWDTDTSRPVARWT